jgi:hypothetical protein
MSKEKKDRRRKKKNEKRKEQQQAVIPTALLGNTQLLNHIILSASVTTYLIEY